MSKKKRVVLLCPGRGSYTRELLGSLKRTPSVEAANALRAALGRPTPSELDAAPEYTSRLHVAGENASILTAACALADADALSTPRAAEQVEVVAVVGNSMGWYTALCVAGALPLDAGLQLIETFGAYQAGNVIGGQLLYPMVGDDWLPDADALAAVEGCLRDIPGLYLSIWLGGQLVLGGTKEALSAAMARLPKRKMGEREFPALLPLHSAFHTPLLAATSQRAFGDLSALPWRAPTIPLVDGRGVIFRPRAADPAAIRDYTLGHQVVAPYDFTASLQTVLAEYAPDALVHLGPGSNLGGAAAQAMIAVGWQGIRSRSDFIARQASDPFVLAMARPEQRARLVAE